MIYDIGGARFLPDVFFMPRGAYARYPPRAEVAAASMLALLIMTTNSPGMHRHPQSTLSPPGMRASSVGLLLVSQTSAAAPKRCLHGAHMSLRDRGRDNEVRHRSRVVRERSSSHAARGARSQPLPGQTPRSADGPSRSAGFGKRLASRSASGKRKSRQRMGRAPPQSVKRPSSGYRRADDGSVFVDAQMVDAVLARRERARKAGDFVSADRLREVLRTSFGVEVLDDVRAWRTVDQRARRPRSGPAVDGADLVALEFFFRGLALYVHRSKYSGPFGVWRF